MAILPALARVILPPSSGVPDDVVVNDFAMLVDDASVGALTPVFEGFFNDVQPSGTRLAGYISSLISRDDPVQVQYYVIDLATGHLNSPVGVEEFDLDPAGTSESLPPEVALCTSFAAFTPPGTVPARARGRVYLGPFTETTNVAGAPSDPLVLCVQEATKGLADQLIGLDSALGIWSRVDQEVRGVVRGWVDNAWDTQRRRGRDATSRLNWYPV